MFLKLRWLAVLLVLGGFMLTGLPAPGADEKKPEKGEPEKTAGQVIEDAVTAYKMAEFGRKNDAPEALVAAASMLRSLKGAKLTPVKEKPKVEGDGAAEDVKTKSFGDEAEDLFEEASTLGLKLKQTHVEALIKAAKARQYRGLIGGAQTIKRTISPKQTQVFNFEFEPNKSGSVGFSASFPMKVTVVRSDNSYVIADAVLAQGTAHHTFQTSKTGVVPVTVRVQNLSGQAGTFQLFVN